MRLFFYLILLPLIISSCESGGWVESDESRGIYPDLDNGHIYQLVLWEKYYSYKPWGACSGGGRNFTVVYYLVDYTLGNTISYKPYKLAKVDRRVREEWIVDKFCKGKPEFAAFVNVFKTAQADTSEVLTDSLLKHVSDSLYKRTVYLCGRCGAEAIFKQNIIDTKSEILLFYNSKGKLNKTELDIDSNRHLLDVIYQNDSCFVVFGDKHMDSLLYYVAEHRNRETVLTGPLKYVDLSAIPDSVKLDGDDLNRNYMLYSGNGHLRLLWFNQKDTPPINPQWMLYGFDEMWYVNDDKVNFYDVPYITLTNKLAKLR